MPGMMDSVLNLGLNDQSVEGLTGQTGSSGSPGTPTVGCCRCTARSWASAGTASRRPGARQGGQGRPNDVELDAGDLRRLVEEFKGIIAADTGASSPRALPSSSISGIEAVFGSWDNKRAVDYRRKNKIDDALGTASTSRPWCSEQG